MRLNSIKRTPKDSGYNSSDAVNSLSRISQLKNEHAETTANKIMLNKEKHKYVVQVKSIKTNQLFGLYDSGVGAVTEKVPVTPTGRTSFRDSAAGGSGSETETATAGAKPATARRLSVLQ